MRGRNVAGRRRPRRQPRRAGWGGRRRLLFLLSVLVVTAPIAPPRRLAAQEVRPLVLQTWQLALGTGYDLRDRRQEGVLSFPDAEERKSIATALLDVEAHGYAYHPRLLRFDLQADVTYGWEDQRSSSDLFSGSGRHRLTGYEIAVDVLQNHRLSYGLRALRSSAVRRGTYFRDRTVRLQRLQHLVRWRNAAMPLLFAYENSTYRGSDAFLIDERRRAFSVDGTRRSGDGNELQAGYRISDYSDLTSEVHVWTQELTARRLTTSADRHRFYRTNFYGYAQSSGSGRYLLGGDVRTLHSRSLESHLFGSVERLRNGPRRLWILDGRGSINHRLYKSLVTTLATDTRYARGPDEVGVRLGGEGELDYRKRVPVGSLALTYRLRQEYRDEDNPETVVRVDGEVHTAAIGAPIVLDRQAVVETSIEVADSTRVRLYQRGRDYDVLVRERVTELRILPTGSIEEGSLLYVSYEYLPAADQTYGNTIQNAEVRLRLWRLASLFAGRGLNRIEASRSTDAANLDEVTENRYGGELYLWRLTTRAERTLRDSRFVPYRLDRVNQSFQQPLAGALSIDLNADYSEVRYAMTGERNRVRTAGAHFALERQRLQLRSGFTVRDEDLAGDLGTYRFFDTDLHWWFNRYELQGTLQFGREDVEFRGRRWLQDVSFELRRYF